MSTIPIHGDGMVNGYHFSPDVTVELSYGEVTRTGDTISLEVTCSLNAMASGRVFSHRLDVWAKLGDGAEVLLFTKPGIDESGKGVGAYGSTVSSWKSGVYKATKTVTEVNTTTSTKLNLIVRWCCCSCKLKGQKIVAKTINLTAPRTLNKYTISYSANGGSNPPSSQEKTENTDLKLRDSKPTAPTGRISLNPNGGTCTSNSVTGTRECKGWNTKADGSGVSYALGAMYSENSDATMYARWGGYVLPTLPNCTRADCNFAGWYFNGNKYEKGSTLPYSATPELTAQWAYHVNYDANGGTGAPSQQIKTHGVNLTLRTAIPIFTGYTFLGWSDSADATVPTYSAGGIYSSNKPVTLYAVWQKDMFSVKYDYAGGVDAEGRSSSTVNVAYGQDATPPTVWREGYYFDGWSDDSEDITSNKTIVAQWQRSRLHTMTNQGNWAGKTNSQEIIYEYRGGKWVKCLKLHSYDGKDWGDVK